MSVSLIGVVSCAVLCLCMAARSLRIGAAPGFAEHRWFGAIALGAFVYSALELVTLTPGLDPPPGLVVAAGAVRVAAVALHPIAWNRHARALLGAPGPLDRLLEAAFAAAAALALVPGVAFTGEVRTLLAAELGARSPMPVPTLAGQAILALAALALALTAVRLLLARRRAVAGVRMQGAALGVVTAIFVHDALASAGRLATPYPSGLALIAPIAALGWTLTSRFVAEARALDALRRDLQGAVAERTEALHRTQEAFLRTERLAAVGAFAAGVAHQVNNPLSAIGSSLAYLAEVLPAGPEGDVRGALDDAQAALARISAVTRRLGDASRLAAAPSHPGAATQLVRAVEDAVFVARRALGEGPAAPAAFAVPVEVDVPPTLWVAAAHDLVVEVVASLVGNGIEAAIGRAGGVRIAGRAEDGRVRLGVEDDGAGVAPEVLHRVFEPFFTTRRDPSAAGLGLAISRGLVASAGGDLTLESAPGRGTRARVELPAGAPPEDPATPAAGPPGPT